MATKQRKHRNMSHQLNSETAPTAVMYPIAENPIKSHRITIEPYWRVLTETLYLLATVSSLLSFPNPSCSHVCFHACVTVTIFERKKHVTLFMYFTYFWLSLTFIHFHSVLFFRDSRLPNLSILEDFLRGLGHFKTCCLDRAVHHAAQTPQNKTKTKRTNEQTSLEKRRHE